VHHCTSRKFNRLSRPLTRSPQILVQGDTAMLWVDQHVRCKVLPWTWRHRAVVPTLIVFKFGRSPQDGRPVITVRHFVLRAGLR
jgi:hypothetical protein